MTLHLLVESRRQLTDWLEQSRSIVTPLLVVYNFKKYSIMLCHMTLLLSGASFCCSQYI